MQKNGILFALILAGTAIVSTSPAAQATKLARRANQLIAALEQANNADSLAAASLVAASFMGVAKHRDQALSLLGRAVDLAPDRTDLVWLQAQQCALEPTCNVEPIEQRLRELDPANGAGWWGALARAGAAHDAEAIDTALTAIGHSERFDRYWTTLVAHLSTAIIKTKQMSTQEAEVGVIGYIEAQIIPAYQYLVLSCKAEHLDQPGVTDTCRGVAKALRNGDTVINEMIGVAIAKHVWPEDSPEWKAAAEERRVYDYRSSFYQKLSTRMMTHPGEFLDLCARYHREQDVLIGQLTAAGIPANPPSQ